MADAAAAPIAPPAAPRAPPESSSAHNRDVATLTPYISSEMGEGLSSPSLSPSAHHRLYPITTLLLIATLHLLFVRQRHRRVSRSDVIATSSYRTIVRRGIYHRALGAMLSHPPPGPSPSLSSLSVRRWREEEEGGGGEAEARRSRSRADSPLNFLSYPLVRATRWCGRVALPVLDVALHPLIRGRLSGLPLLTYVSHVLWQCRSLEEWYCLSRNEREYGYDDGGEYREKTVGLHDGSGTREEGSSFPWAYARVLVGLSLVAMGLELACTRYLLIHTSPIAISLNGSGTVDQGGEEGGSTAARTATTMTATDTHKILLDRGLCTLTLLASALIVEFGGMYPRVPLDILPFLPTSAYFAFESPYLGGPALTRGLCILTLLILSWRLHPATSVLFGTTSGLLWSTGMTSWLASEYWGNCMLLTVGAAIALSAKAEETGRLGAGAGTRGGWIPFVDYVSWDYGRGEMCADVAGGGTSGRASAAGVGAPRRPLLFHGRIDEERGTVPFGSFRESEESEGYGNMADAPPLSAKEGGVSRRTGSSDSGGNYIHGSGTSLLR